MDYIVNDEKVQPGDKILTSGEDRIFPKDLPIGTVESAKPGNSVSDHSRLQPAARLDRLEEVLVLLSQQELTPKKTEEAARHRALRIPAPFRAPARAIHAARAP